MYLKRPDHEPIIERQPKKRKIKPSLAAAVLLGLVMLMTRCDPEVSVTKDQLDQNKTDITLFSPEVTFNAKQTLPPMTNSKPISLKPISVATDGLSVIQTPLIP